MESWWAVRRDFANLQRLILSAPLGQVCLVRLVLLRRDSRSFWYRRFLLLDGGISVLQGLGPVPKNV